MEKLTCREEVLPLDLTSNDHFPLLKIARNTSMETIIPTIRIKITSGVMSFVPCISIMI